MLDIINKIILKFFISKFDLEIDENYYKCEITDVDNIITAVIDFNFALGDVQNELEQYIENAIATSENNKIIVKINSNIIAHKTENMVQGKNSIKNIIAISSGKGGVGKSTVALNLALSLQQLGARVGLLDADIHGPSQPTMLGVTQDDLKARASGLHPVKKLDLETASISYFMTKDDPVIWRGPMVSRALEQLVHDISWGELDFLLVDMPPGTGDVALTLVKKIPVVAAVIITTPQDIAYIDAEKSAQMYAKTKVPVLGVIENMSGYVCSSCGQIENIFGEQGGAKLAACQQVPLLGKVPLLAEIRVGSDNGSPAVSTNKALADIYAGIGIKIGAQLSLRPQDYVRKFNESIS